MPVYSAFQIMTKLPNELKEFWLFFISVIGIYLVLGAWNLGFCFKGIR